MKPALRQFVTAAVLFVAGLTGANAPAIAGPHRPPAVPSEYVVTPFGYFHPSCVVHLAAGDELLRNEDTIRHTDGTATPMPVCAYAHYRADGERVFGDERAVHHPDISHAYVELVTVTTGGSYGSLSAQWSVPPTPATDDGQTLFIFPGMEDTNDVVTIIQPVLGWNSDYKSAWGIASWNCCENGSVYEAPPERVASGDTILGTIQQTCAAGTKSCGTWNIVTQDLRTGASSALTNTSSFGQTFNWAFAGALEVYDIVQCSDYPTTSAYPGGDTISFNSLRLFNKQLVQIDYPTWKVSTTPKGLSPQCNYGASVSKQIILNN